MVPTRFRDMFARIDCDLGHLLTEKARENLKDQAAENDESKDH
jgi:hypothetical protein